MTYCSRIGAASAALLLITSVTIAGQRAGETPRALTSPDYARAEKFLSYNTTPLVLHAVVGPTWLPDERFTYSTTTADGTESRPWLWQRGLQVRRRLDYFVRHLLGAEPPQGYELHPPAQTRPLTEQ